METERAREDEPTPESWKGAGWELIPEIPLSPAANVALDQVLLSQVGAGQRPPTLRFWGWGGQALVLGSFQSVRNEVEEDVAREMGVEIVRRMSGGGTMFVQPGRTITYSLYVPEHLLKGVGIAASYALCDGWVVNALRAMGLEAWYAPLNDIACAGGKIAGAAQARRPGIILHHTTMAYEMRGEEMMRLIRIGRERRSDKGIVSAAKQVYPLHRQTELSREQIVARLTEHFQSTFGLKETALSAQDLLMTEELVASKYGTESWTYSLP